MGLIPVACGKTRIKGSLLVYMPFSSCVKNLVLSNGKSSKRGISYIFSGIYLCRSGSDNGVPFKMADVPINTLCSCLSLSGLNEKTPASTVLRASITRVCTGFSVLIRSICFAPFMLVSTKIAVVLIVPARLAISFNIFRSGIFSIRASGLVWR